MQLTGQIHKTHVNKCKFWKKRCAREKQLFHTYKAKSTKTLTSCNTECCGGTLSCSNAVGGETCVSSYITGCSIEDGQRWCGCSTTTVFVGVGIGSDGCYGTTNISLPLYIIYL
jgi:hypothetical protein